MKKVLRVMLGLVGLIIVLAIGLVAYLTIREYKPEAVEELTIEGQADSSPAAGESFSLLTWNIGYGALGESADYFMDGGQQVMTATKEEVVENVTAMAEAINALDPDVIFLQEMDVQSDRSHDVDERAMMTELLNTKENAFAYNFNVDFVPYPLPPIGQVRGGIATFSDYRMTSAERVALPCPFGYPVRVANLKRCLLVSRVPVEGSDRELVLINFHLEAYDDGEGKAAQTAMLRDYIDNEIAAGNYVIAGGDLNQVFSSVNEDKFPIVSRTAWQPGVIAAHEFENARFYTGEDVASCRSLEVPLTEVAPEEMQYYIIDGFIVSDNLTVEACETVDLGFQYSDHNPVTLTVRLTP
ncbi:MAG: endonuclease/exonuclease/phosphatase family protein [Lachnospiraceae bacterium]|nr:endonuclease/exonuclease/phosphatase family protein [Lachnospiraceae bacterium]